jgi:hypothetical protein
VNWTILLTASALAAPMIGEIGTPAGSPSTDTGPTTTTAVAVAIIAYSILGAVASPPRSGGRPGAAGARSFGDRLPGQEAANHPLASGVGHGGEVASEQIAGGFGQAQPVFAAPV